MERNEKKEKLKEIAKQLEIIQSADKIQSPTSNWVI